MPSVASHASSRSHYDFTKLQLRGQSTDELLKKVKTLQGKLSQDVGLSTLGDVHKQLCTRQLMLHKDAAVRVSVAYCLAEILRLSAPNAPFTANDLQDILQMFLMELTSPKGGLSRPNEPQYADYVALADSISRAKSIALLTDLPRADDMMVDWFKRLFDVVRPDMAKNVEIALADILAQAIDECQTLPSDVLDILLANFSVKATKLNPAAHRLAVQICSDTSDRLQSYIAQYFSETIVSASSEEDLDEKEKELRTSHSLIAQINRTVPSLLLNVIAVLEQELTAEDLVVRQIATKTLGQMFGEKTSAGLAIKYPNAWKAWLGRSRDKVSAMRVLWVESISGILANHPELRADITPVLREKLTDPDEKVRATLVRVIGNVDFETALHHLEKSFLQTLSERLRDRRPAVRVEAQEAFGRLYSLAYSGIESHDPLVIKQFAWIPNALLNPTFIDAQSTVPLIACFEKYILPLPNRAEEEAAWVNRLLTVLKYVDDRGIKTLMLRLNNMQAPHSRKPYIPFVESCEAYNGGVMGADKEAEVLARLKAAIRGCAGLMPVFDKAAADLLAFAKMNDSRILRLFKVCMEPSTDMRTWIKARAEALRRIEAADEKLVATATGLLQLSTYPFFNRNSVPTILKRLSRNELQWRESQVGVANESGSSSLASEASQPATLASSSDVVAFKTTSGKLMHYTTKFCAEMYYPHISEMINLVHEESNAALTEPVLKALCSVKRSGKAVTLDKKSIDRVAKFVRKGSPLQAKYGARLLSLVKDASTAQRTIEEVLSDLSSRLSNAKPSQLLADLSALGQFIKHAPAAAENVWDGVVREVLKDLSKNWPSNIAESYEAGEDWVDDEAMEDSARVKLMGLDLLCKRGMATTGETEGAPMEMTIPVFRLLFKTLDNGEPRELGTPEPVKARLRLKSALCILKLATVPACEKAITQDFINLSLVVQDPSFQVRSQYLYKLLLCLSRTGTQKKLSTRFHAIPFMAAIDPESENREMVMQWSARARQMPAEERLKKIEMTFCRYIHLLSQHPDFSRSSSQTIRDFVPYIQFYLDCVASEQNVGLLFYLAGRLKTVRDGASQGASENLYTLSELAQLVIKYKAARHNWRLEQFPGSFKIPSDTGLKALPSAEAQKQVYETVWLPASVTDALENDINKAERKRAGDPISRRLLSAASARKRPAAGATGASASSSKGAKKSRRSPSKVKKSSHTSGNGRNDEDDDVVGSDSDSELSSAGGAAQDDEEMASEVSSDEAVSDGEAEGRGARQKAAKIERNRKRAERRASRGGGGGAGAGVGAGGTKKKADEDSDLSDVE